MRDPIRSTTAMARIGVVHNAGEPTPTPLRIPQVELYLKNKAAWEWLRACREMGLFEWEFMSNRGGQGDPMSRAVGMRSASTASEILPLAAECFPRQWWLRSRSPNTETLFAGVKAPHGCGPRLIRPTIPLLCKAQPGTFENWITTNEPRSSDVSPSSALRSADVGRVTWSCGYFDSEKAPLSTRHWDADLNSQKGGPHRSATRRSPLSSERRKRICLLDRTCGDWGGAGEDGVEDGLQSRAASLAMARSTSEVAAIELLDEFRSDLQLRLRSFLRAILSFTCRKQFSA